MPRSAFSDTYSVLIGALVDARRGAELTQTALAASLGKPQSYVSKVERGERRIDLIEFAAWARAAGHRPSELLATIEDKLQGFSRPGTA